MRSRGPQWVEEDFDDEDDEVEDGEGDAEGAAEGVAVAGDAGVKACAQDPTERVSIDEARRRVQKVVVDWVAETVKAEAGNRPGT